MRAIPKGSVIEDEVHGQSYRIKHRLGQGGFGVAYLAHRLNEHGGERRNGETCLKFSLHADEWHGEVYFSNLIRNVGHVVRMNSAFPARVRQGKGARMAFVIDMEFVPAGTVRDHFESHECMPWSEDQVAFRIRQLLKPLSLLHGMGVSHRDITPPNVFLGNRKVLKLGDFGITKAQLHPSGVHADVANWPFTPRDLGRWWSPADDVYQVGLLAASLLAGEELDHEIKRPFINQITKKGPIRDAIKAAIDVKSRRPATAVEFARLLGSS